MASSYSCFRSFHRHHTRVILTKRSRPWRQLSLVFPLPHERLCNVQSRIHISIPHCTAFSAFTHGVQSWSCVPRCTSFAMHRDQVVVLPPLLILCRIHWRLDAVPAAPTRTRPARPSLIRQDENHVAPEFPAELLRWRRLRPTHRRS